MIPESLKTWLDSDCTDEHGESVQNMMFHDEYSWGNNKVPAPDGWTAKSVEHHGGEGQGDSYYTIYSFVNDINSEEIFIKFDGWYASHYGADFDAYYEVQPKETQVTQYERVPQ